PSRRAAAAGAAGGESETGRVKRGGSSAWWGSLEHALDERGVRGVGGELEVLLVVAVGLLGAAGPHVALAEELVDRWLLRAHVLGLLAARASVRDLSLREQLLTLGEDLAGAARGRRRLGRRRHRG